MTENELKTKVIASLGILDLEVVEIRDLKRTEARKYMGYLPGLVIRVQKVTKAS
jgi:hypothetical protein